MPSNFPHEFRDSADRGAMLAETVASLTTLAPFIASQRAAEAVRAADHAKEAARQSRSGFGVDLTAYRGRTDAEITADAEQAKASREEYLTSNIGKARKSIADGCRKAEQLHARLHDVGAALSRGDGSAIRKAEDAAEALHSLRLLVADMEAFVRLSEAGELKIAAE